ncbi:MAG: hypothetical protein ACRED8_04445 [Caulobacteraceae bacterium]
MQGDLDRPPIVIRKAQLKTALMAAVSAALAIVLFIIWSRSPALSSTWWSILGAIFFALSSLVFAWEVVRGEQLRLSPEGLQWRGPRKTLTYPWDRLSEFSVVSTGASKLIGFTILDEGAPPNTLSRINAALIGNSAALPGLWEVKPEKVAEILNSARARWGSAP